MQSSELLYCNQNKRCRSLNEKKRKRRIVPWQYIFLMVVVNKQYTTYVKLKHSRSRQRIMAVVTSPRRETNNRLRPAGHLETDGFTVKSLLKNAKVLIFN
jgi:hypothetical protein